MSIPVCATCNSEDVFLDAWAYWDNQNKCWALYNTFDYSYCNKCEGDTTLYWIEDEPISSDTKSQDTKSTD